MAQFSVEITRLPGSVPNGNQQTTALARAQIAAVVGDGRAVARTVATSLAAIRAASADAARLLAAEDRPDSEDVLQALQMGKALLDALLAEAGIATAAIDRAAVEVSPVAALADGALAEFGAVARATVQVRLAAVNATLHAALGQAMRALEGVMAALAQVDPLRRETVANLHRLDRTGATAEEALARIVEGVEGLSALMSVWPAEVRASDGDLGDLMALYTMETERVVHRRLFGLPDPSIPAPTAMPAPDDALADVLF